MTAAQTGDRSVTKAAIARLSGAPGGAARWVLLVALMVGALLAGALWAPAEFAPLVRGDVVSAGGVPVDSGFTLLAFAAGVVAFRTWERMFPARLPTLWIMYPLHGSVIAWRELRTALTEGTIAGALVALVWLPALVVQPTNPQLIAGICYALIGGYVLGGLAFALPVAVAHWTLKQSPTASDAAARLAVSAAPAASFGGSLVILLLFKLGVDELVLRSLADSRDAAAIVLELGPVHVSRAAVAVLLSAILLTKALVLTGLVLRARRYLHDAVRLSAALDRQPDLSYAWITADRLEAAADRSEEALVSFRERARFTRRAPFRLLGTVSLSVLATVLVFALGSEVARLVVTLLLVAWLLPWLRIAWRFVEQYGPQEREADALLLSPHAVARGRRRAALRTCAFYALFVLPAGGVALLVHGDILVAALAGATALLLSLSPLYALRTRRG